MTNPLEARVAELERQLAARRGQPRLRRLRRRSVLLAAVLAAMALPVGVLASHQFTDVPNTNTFHSQISLLADAGITRGCNLANTLYCPADPVRRDQMAAFLVRSAGRAAVETFLFPTSTPGTILADVTVKAEGDALLLAHTSTWFNISAGESPNFPCEGFIYMALDGTEVDDDLSGLLGAGTQEQPVDTDFEQSAAQTAWVVEAGNHTVNLVYFGLDDGNCVIEVGGGSLTAMIVPFGGTGGTPTVERPAPTTAPELGGGVLSGN
jgi:hypothetical protein